MDAEKVIQDLNRRFAAPLPEFYKRRIIVWHDEDAEFTAGIADIALTNAKIAVLTGTNNFAVKKLLCADDTTSNYLLYCPFAYEDMEDNWLLDIELYSEEFRADLISMWMDEMGVPQTPALRKCFKAYRKFFNAKERRKQITTQPTTPAQLQMAIMAVLAGIKDAKPNAIIRAVLQAGLSAETNNVYQNFVSYGIDGAFRKMVEQGTGYQADATDPGKLAVHILLTAVTRTLRREFLAGLDEYIASAHQAYCYDFVSDWLHDSDPRGIREIAEYVESEAKLPQRFMNLTPDDLSDTEIFPCIDEVILVKLMRDIGDHIINVEAITRAAQKRRTCVWYEAFRDYYEGLAQLADMQAFYRAHSAGFHTVEPKKLWEEYTSTFYVMDTCYRRFHKSYQESLKNYHPELSDLFASVKDRVEGLYVNWFLGQLGESWSEACADSLRDCGSIPEIPQQADFYHDRIEHSDSRVYVIIADALRYEVAVSLAEQLQRETQSKVKLSSMQGIFPTVTKFGMAALLPHKQLSVEMKAGGLAVLADGQSTEAGNRDKILKAADPASVALKYKDIIGMKRAERQALVKGMDIVYIYHDTIDEAGHLDQSVFGACDDAIDEIKNIVRIITNELSGTYIYITADHGFLYTYDPLQEDDKVDLTADRGGEVGRRYAILPKGAQPQYLLPVKFLDGDTDYDAFAPRESMRIRMKGGGMNFVHGGISLQEMVVPLIDYHFLRNDSKEYRRNRSKYDTKPVTISLLSSGHKISNMIFSLTFFQKDAVSANREAANYQLYFTDGSGKVISDVVRVIADKTNTEPQERTFRSSFNLKSLKYSNTESYYLVTADENGLQVSREEFQIDIAFAVDEFDFFS